jgi:hypothetical protein
MTLHKKFIVYLITLAGLLAVQSAFGQEELSGISLQPGLREAFFAPPADGFFLPFPDSSEAAKPKIKLLPDHLSLMESALWGEHGLMRITGIAPLTPSARKSELSVRRTMLTAHQIGGFITMGLFIPTLIYGQRNINQWNASESGQGTLDKQLDRTHKNWAGYLFASYMVTGGLSILSPPPFIRRDDWGTTSLHKTLAWVHFAGMVAIPFLGSAAASADRDASRQAHPDYSRAKSLRTIHQIVAYTTAAAFTASLVIMTF